MQNRFRQQLLRICEKCKEQTAIGYLQKNDEIEYLSYGGMLQKIEHLEGKLKKIGVEKTDRVAIITPHSPDGVIAGVTLAYMGCTAVMIDASLPVLEIQRLLKEGDAVAAFVDVTMQEQLGDDVLGSYPVFDLNGMTGFALSEKGKRQTRKSEGQDRDEEVIAIIFSSGTTSQMKGICITYKSILESIRMYRYLTGVKRGNRYLYVLPFNHIAGYSAALQYLLMGCELDMIQEMNSSKLSKGFHAFNPHYFAMVPKVYEIIAEKITGEISKQGKEKAFRKMMAFSRFMRKKLHVNIGKILFVSVRHQTFGTCMKGIGAGASPCKKETADFFLALGYNWANFYSSTETGVPAVATGVHDIYPDDTVGNIRQFEDIDVRLVNQDNEGMGEIAVKTPLGMKGYFRNEKLTKETINKDGYILTGDLGKIGARGYLQVVGRAKEVMILRNGKKVSPYDIERMYGKWMDRPVELVCCGVQNERDGYDEIHLFLEKQSQVEKYVKTIREISKHMTQIYKVEQIHIVSEFPKTAVGKVKRLELAQRVKEGRYVEKEQKLEGLLSEQQSVKRILCQVSGINEIRDDKQTLREDLQLDSLQLFELAVEIQKIFGINIISQFSAIETVGDVISVVESGRVSDREKDVDYDIQDFPSEKSFKDCRRLYRWMKWMRRIYHIDVEGKENIPSQESFILAANHASNFDPIWMLAALDEKKRGDNVVCLAAKHTMEGFVNNRLFRMLGGIPVNREGNTVPVLLRAKECLDQGKMLIIFPEGARSRDGSMLPFKEGCAQIAWKAKKSIVPVSIEGGFEIFPRWRKLPRIFNIRKLRRYQLKITFCKPISPSQDYDEMMDKVKKEIEG